MNHIILKEQEPSNKEEKFTIHVKKIKDISFQRRYACVQLLKENSSGRTKREFL